jgi:hypothetical protein
MAREVFVPYKPRQRAFIRAVDGQGTARAIVGAGCERKGGASP